MEKLKPVEHKFKAIFYEALKSLLTRRSNGSYRQLDASQFKNVIIFRPDRIGDMVITLPLIDALKRHFPPIKVSILASPKNLSLIKDDTRFDKIFIYKKSLWSSPAELWKIRNARFDCVIDTVFEDSVTTLFLSHFCAAGSPIIGMGKNKYAGYYDFNSDNSGGHIIDNTLKLLGAFGIDSSKVTGYAELRLSETVIENATEFMKSLSSSRTSSINIGLNLSSGAPTRVWQTEKWIDLIRSIQTTQPNSQIILITIPAERSLASEIKKQFHETAHLVPDKLDIAGVSAIIKELNVLITPDTSLVHIARAYQVPVVGLYTSNDRNFKLWHPYGMKSNVAKAIHDDNIFDITVEQVLDVVARTMGVQQEVRR